jgi:TonB family protein
MIKTKTLRNSLRAQLPESLLTTGLAALLFTSWISVAKGAQDPHAQLRTWAELGQTEAIRELLAENETIDVDSPGEGGWTALMYAARAGNDDIVLILIDADADIHRTNAGKETPLHLTAKHGRAKTVRILLAAGADISVRDDEGRTPLFRAVENGHGDVTEVLREKAQSMVDDGQSMPSSPDSEEETIPPQIIESAPPIYTDQARDKGVEGTVVLMVLVRRDGTIGGTSVSKGIEESLDLQALETVRKWKFAPATRADKPVDALLEIALDFTLPKKKDPF